MDPLRELGRTLLFLGGFVVLIGALLFFGGNCPSAWDASPATLSTAASTPPSTFRS